MLVDGDLRARLIPGPLLLRVAERTLGRSGAAAGNPAGVAPSTFVLVHCMVGILRCAAVLPLVSCSTHGMTPSRTNSYVLRSYMCLPVGHQGMRAASQSPELFLVLVRVPGVTLLHRFGRAAPFSRRPTCKAKDAVRFHGQQMQIVFTVQNTVLFCTVDDKKKLHERFITYLAIRGGYTMCS